MLCPRRPRSRSAGISLERAHFRPRCPRALCLLPSLALASLELPGGPAGSLRTLKATSRPLGGLCPQPAAWGLLQPSPHFPPAPWISRALGDAWQQPQVGQMSRAGQAEGAEALRQCHLPLTLPLFPQACGGPTRPRGPTCRPSRLHSSHSESQWGGREVGRRCGRKGHSPWVSLQGPG